MAGLLQYSAGREDSEGDLHTGSHEAIDNLAYQLYSQFRLEENRKCVRAFRSSEFLVVRGGVDLRA